MAVAAASPRAAVVLLVLALAAGGARGARGGGCPGSGDVSLTLSSLFLVVAASFVAGAALASVTLFSFYRRRVWASGWPCKAGAAGSPRKGGGGGGSSRKRGPGSAAVAPATPSSVPLLPPAAPGASRPRGGV